MINPLSSLQEEQEAPQRSIVERVRRYLQLQESPEFQSCPRCNGQGYHHGFGEHGWDPEDPVTNDDVRQVAELLRQFRLEPSAAGSRMPWAPDWPLDRLMVTAAELLVASPPAPSGWQQRIAATAPFRQGVADDYCFFCGASKLTVLERGHRSECLWQNAVDAGQPAKDAIPPAPPATCVTDCRSEDGITVGLIDSIITSARLLRGRAVSPAVAEALRDLQADADVRAVALPPVSEASPAKPEFDDLLRRLVVAAQRDRRVDSTEQLIAALAALDGIREAIRQSWKCGGCGCGFATVGHMLHVSNERAVASSDADPSPLKDSLPTPVESKETP